jgi:hypothetical protein
MAEKWASGFVFGLVLAVVLIGVARVGIERGEVYACVDVMRVLLAAKQDSAYDALKSAHLCVDAAKETGVGR